MVPIWCLIFCVLIHAFGVFKHFKDTQPNVFFATKHDFYAKYVQAASEVPCMKAMFAPLLLFPDEDAKKTALMANNELPTRN